MGKPRKLPYQIITPVETILAGQPYELLSEVRAEQHFDCAEARIALAWRKGTKPNVDGHLVLGRCVLLDELHKRKIDLADEVFVLNVGGYIGSSTRSEIDYAVAHGKPVSYLEGN